MKPLITGILAHVDAGKTTLSEAMLYCTGRLKRLGRVDHRDSFLDTHSLERARGITIFSKQARLTAGNTEITLLDTPGHVDFSPETERTLPVLDCAVLVISGTDGVQAHTLTLWQLLRRYHVPTFLFINKMDLPGCDAAGLMQQIKQRLCDSCVNFSQSPQQTGEEAALCSEGALEEFVQTGQVCQRTLAELVAREQLFPCFFGSALRLSGVEALLSGLDSLTSPRSYPAQFSARVYQIGRDPQGNRLTYLKVTGGCLPVRTAVSYRLPEGEALEEKVKEIRLYSGSRFEATAQAPAGSVCAVLGLTRTYPGLRLGAEQDSGFQPVLEPVMTYRLCLPPGCDPAQMLPKLRQLEEEEPQLHLVWDSRLQEIRAQLMGPVQIEILKSLVQERFDIALSVEAGQILYKETIAAPVEGVGHFEPLRHYAEVHLLLEPLPPGSGLVFDTRCSEDVLERSWQRLILTHLQERTHLGVLTGSPITDMKLTLMSGRAHLKHTEGGDFRQATYRAVRHGLMQAESVLLEPWYSFRLELPSGMLGRAMTDFERMHAELSAPELTGERAVLTGAGPVRLLRGCTAEVTSYTRGQGKISYQPAGYRPCAQQDEIVKRIGYDPERDLLHPTGSVFCSHGAGFEVKWDEVDRMAHLPLLDFSPKQEPEKPQRIVRSVAPGGAPELEKELLAIFERTYGQIKRRDVLPMMALRSQDKKELLARMEPAEEFVLVDGYNIIFAWDELKEIGRDSLDAARHVLMNLLCNYQGYRGCNLILVFDAYKVPQNLGMVEKYHNIFIVYTQEAETADSYIERVTYELRGRKRVRVATSDNLEQLIILGHGAVRVSAKSFHDEVMQTQQEIERILAQNNQKNQ